MTFTKLHVVISLIAILTGLVVLIGLISGRRFNGWTAWSAMAIFARYCRRLVGAIAAAIRFRSANL